jgi:hypothetical protein
MTYLDKSATSRNALNLLRLEKSAASADSWFHIATTRSAKKCLRRSARQERGSNLYECPRVLQRPLAHTKKLVRVDIQVTEENLISAYEVLFQTPQLKAFKT